jgi:hypothetical protein
MLTLNESLKIKPDYTRSEPLHPIVMALYREYVGTGNYPYLEAVVDYILVHHPEHTEKREALKTQVYFASHRCRDEKENEYRESMLAAGWIILTTGWVTEAKKQGKRIRLLLRSDGVLGHSVRDVVCRPFLGATGEEFLMPPKARSRGYSVAALTVPWNPAHFIQLVE